jgi:hypothetical protein
MSSRVIWALAFMTLVLGGCGAESREGIPSANSKETSELAEASGLGFPESVQIVHSSVGDRDATGQMDWTLHANSRIKIPSVVSGPLSQDAASGLLRANARKTDAEIESALMYAKWSNAGGEWRATEIKTSRGYYVILRCSR